MCETIQESPCTQKIILYSAQQGQQYNRLGLGFRASDNMIGLGQRHCVFNRRQPHQCAVYLAINVLYTQPSMCCISNMTPACSIIIIMLIHQLSTHQYTDFKIYKLTQQFLLLQMETVDLLQWLAVRLLPSREILQSPSNGCNSPRKLRAFKTSCHSDTSYQSQP